MSTVVGSSVKVVVRLSMVRMVGMVVLVVVIVIIIIIIIIVVVVRGPVTILDG